MDTEIEDSQWTDTDSDEELLFMQYVHINYSNSQRNRSYLTRAGIVQPQFSSWNHLLENADFFPFSFSD
jgi:hypothetical protein